MTSFHPATPSAADGPGPDRPSVAARIDAEATLEPERFAALVEDEAAGPSARSASGLFVAGDAPVVPPTDGVASGAEEAPRGAPIAGPKEGAATALPTAPPFEGSVSVQATPSAGEGGGPRPVPSATTLQGPHPTAGATTVPIGEARPEPAIGPAEEAPAANEALGAVTKPTVQAKQGDIRPLGAGSMPSDPNPPSAASAPLPAVGAPAPAVPATPSPLTAPLSTPLAAPDDAAHQVVRAVAASDARSVELRLDPPQLGRVRIEFDFAGDAVRAVVSAAEPETLSLLRRGAGALLRELAEAGMGDVSLDFAEAEGGAAAEWPDAPSLIPVALAEAVGPKETTPRPLAGPHGRLDLRL